MVLESKSYIAIPPGETIKEQLVDRGISQKEFAIRMDCSEKHISKLINGEVLLTTDMAIKLEMVLGIPAKFWNNLEFFYRETLAKIEIENNLEEEMELAKKFPYVEMAKVSLVPNTSKLEEKVINLRKFFEVNRLSLIFEKNILTNVFYRRLTEYNDKDYKMMALIQEAKRQAREIETNPINITGLINNLNNIKKMSNESSDIYLPKIKELLSKFGVAVIYLPNIEGGFLHGLSFKEKNKIVLGLTSRYKDADRFFFSLFHELGHIILNHLDMEYNKELEIEADNFARDNLISPDDYSKFITKSKFTIESIKAFAKEEDISIGIVIGRLQNDGYIPFSNFNGYKDKISF